MTIDLKPLDQTNLKEAQLFMFEIIIREFGYDIRQDWHKDIINLFSTYSVERSLFYVATVDNQVVATIGARPFDKLVPGLESRYNSDDTIGIWRHYVKKELRGKGIGKYIYGEAEKKIKEFSYTNIYLHTQRSIPGSVEYWQKRGFNITLSPHDEWQTVHMEKVIK